MAQPPISYIASSKLEAPTLTPWHVRREQLLERAAQAPVPRVLLVCAPAGFGKTTLLAQLAQQARAGGDAVAWLTLDGADNDAARFVACLAAATGALMAAAETLDGANHPANRQADHPAEEAALALLAALAACTEPFTLFLDEFEHVTDPAVLGLTRALIARLPPDAQIVIGARSLPDLGLGGLRARGRALEFDADALRFSLDESSAFLARRTSLPVQDVQALHRTAEGWAAALWLAAAALERHPHSHAFVDGFSGSQAALASYLADDVLARQDAPIRHFLLRTSILRTLSAPLCDAVLGRADSAALLQAIANANLFLGMRGDAAGEYRYHGLFAGFLRARLAAQAPHDLPVLHAAASRWYEAQGRAVPAIDHAIEAGDVQRSVALLTQHAGGLIAEGRGGLLGRWFDALPAGALQRRPLLHLLRAWALMFTKGAASASALLAEQEPGADESTAVQTCRATLNSILMALADRYEAAWSIGREPLSKLPSGLDFADVALINNLALALLCLGRKDEARALVDASRGHSGQGRSRFNAAVCEAVEGMVDLQEARLREATARLRLAAHMMQPGGGQAQRSRSFVGVPYAEALYEAGRFDAAREMLHVLLPLACNSSIPDHVIGAHVLLARIEFSEGEVDRSFELLNRLEVLGHERRIARWVANARLERSHIYLLQQHLEAARIELARCDVDGVWRQSATDSAVAQDMEYLAIGEFRLALASGQGSAVLAPIAAELARALAAQRSRRAMKLRLLLALATFQAGQTDTAHAELNELLRVASVEGFLRLLLDEGPAVGALCRSLEAAPLAARRAPIQAEYLHRLARSFEAEALPPQALEAGHAGRDSRAGAMRMSAPSGGASVGGAGIVGETPAGPGEPLSSRELRVLKAVADGYSNSAIADKLFISPHTVRGHLRSINGKLQAASRTQAVAIARHFGLLA